MDFSPDKMRARFHVLTAKAEAHRAKLAPVREAREKLIAKHIKEAAPLDAKVKAAEKGLVDIDNERAALVRACGGIMGEADPAA